MIVVIMGVSGSGKTTVGGLVAQHLGCAFSDADDFHPTVNVEKMQAGIPLTDSDRWPWLAALRAAIDGWIAAGESRIIACSALKAAYRDVLSPKGDVTFIYLRGSHETIATRLASRTGHYMNPALLASQFEALEEPSDALVIDITPPPPIIAQQIVERLGQSSGDSTPASEV